MYHTHNRGTFLNTGKSQIHFSCLSGYTVTFWEIKGSALFSLRLTVKCNLGLLFYIVYFLFGRGTQGPSFKLLPEKWMSLKETNWGKLGLMCLMYHVEASFISEFLCKFRKTIVSFVCWPFEEEKSIQANPMFYTRTQRTVGNSLRQGLQKLGLGNIVIVIWDCILSCVVFHLGFKGCVTVKPLLFVLIHGFTHFFFFSTLLMIIDQNSLRVRILWK